MSEEMFLHIEKNIHRAFILNLTESFSLGNFIFQFVLNLLNI